MVKVGQILWWVDRDRHTEGTVTVVRVEKSQFIVKYKGKEHTRDYSVIGNKLFFTSQLQKEKVEDARKSNVKTCSNCFLRYSGECTSLRDELCEDYRTRQTIPQEEIDAWPEYGDVTTFRLRKCKELKKRCKF